MNYAVPACQILAGTKEAEDRSLNPPPLALPDLYLHTCEYLATVVLIVFFVVMT